MGLLLALPVALASILQAQDAVRSQDTLQIQFIDVGQGDAALIRIGRQAVMVDAGRGDDIVLYLEEQGIDSLVAAIASHNHDDHIGGMDAVVADHSVGEYLYNGRPPTIENAKNVMYWVAKRGVPHPPPPWTPITMGDVRITVFPTLVDGDRATENNSSLGVLIERGTFRALLTGDSEQDELIAWLQAGVIPKVTVLKAAHHGARNGLTPGWLEATSPDVVVISVGANNEYGHPDPWALRYYQAAGRKVLRTDRDGTVIFFVDAKGGYRIETLGPIERE